MRNGPVTVYDAAGNLIRGSEDIPPQYLKGWVEWYKLKFKVTPDVLIPRPETELLVDEVLKRSHLFRGETSTVLDVGTGSGCISIAIAKNLPQAKIFAIDISEPALDVAKENAQKNRVEKKIFFLKSDLLDSISARRQALPIGPSGLQNDNLIIVTNLPYIPTSRIGTLDPSVKDFEPHIALDGGPDGFDLYRRLFAQIRDKFIKPVTLSETKGIDKRFRSQSDRKLCLYPSVGSLPQDDRGLKLLVGEIDETQEQLALSESKKYFPQALVEVKKDLAQKPRILIISFA